MLEAEEDKSKQCGVCKEQPWKYKCPGCDLKTCSVPCVKRHKTELGCDGVKKPVEQPAFTPLEPGFSIGNEEQYSDDVCEKDGEFLDGLQNRNSDSVASKSAAGTNNNSAASNEEEDSRRLPRALLRTKRDVQTLVHECRFRKIRLELAPFGLERSRINQSKFEHFSKTIFWTLRLCFEEAEGSAEKPYVYDVHRLAESLTLSTVLKQFLQPKMGGVVSKQTLDMEKLAPFIEAGLDDVDVFMKVERADPKRFHQLDVKQSIGDNLKGKTLIEFPTIFVALRRSCVLFPYPLVSEEELAQIADKEAKSDEKFKHQPHLQVFGGSTVEADGEPAVDSNTAPGLPRLQRFQGDHQHPRGRGRGGGGGGRGGRSGFRGGRGGGGDRRWRGGRRGGGGGGGGRGRGGGGYVGKRDFDTPHFDADGAKDDGCRDVWASVISSSAKRPRTTDERADASATVDMASPMDFFGFNS